MVIKFLQSSLFITTLLLHFLVAQAGERIALVIGNQNYENVISPKNAENDARLVAETLSSLGFKVETVIDADLAGMKKAIADFSTKTPEAPEAALIYYTGHGMAVDDQQFLVPIDATIAKKEALNTEAFSVQQIFNAAKNNPAGVNIFIIDTSRRNPFKGQPGKLIAKTGNGANLEEVYLAFSTSAGSLSLDGSGDHGYYAKALSDAMKIPEISLQEVFRKTRSATFSATDGAQIPWEASSTSKEFYLLPKKNSKVEQ